MDDYAEALRKLPKGRDYRLRRPDRCAHSFLRLAIPALRLRCEWRRPHNLVRPLSLGVACQATDRERPKQ